jgi:hypothetical protein
MLAPNARAPMPGAERQKRSPAHFVSYSSTYALTLHGPTAEAASSGLYNALFRFWAGMLVATVQQSGTRFIAGSGCQPGVCCGIGLMDDTVQDSVVGAQVVLFNCRSHLAMTRPRWVCMQTA